MPRFHIIMALGCAVLAAWCGVRVRTSTAWVLDAVLAIAFGGAVPFWLSRYWTLRRHAQRRDEGQVH
jgi:hypothetical protein